MSWHAWRRRLLLAVLILSGLSKQDELLEIFLIPAQEIPAEELKKLINKSIITKPKDGLVKWLLKLGKIIVISNQ
jgi:hypothetical protein